TLADLVADVRASTPSNAAEIVVDRADNFFGRIERARHRLAIVMRHSASRRRLALERVETRVRRWGYTVGLRQRDCEQLAFRLRQSMQDRIARSDQRFEHWRQRLERRDAHRVVAALRARLVKADARLPQLATLRRRSAEATVGALSGRLHALSPLAVLGRG